MLAQYISDICISIRILVCIFQAIDKGLRARNICISFDVQALMGR